jgi:hypothetical protein
MGSSDVRPAVRTVTTRRYTVNQNWYANLSYSTVRTVFGFLSHTLCYTRDVEIRDWSFKR